MTARNGSAVALAERLFAAALEAVDAERAVLRSAALIGRVLEGKPRPSRVLGLSIGKAARPMARAIASICGRRLDRGFVLVNEGYATGAPADRFEEHQTGHPLPDERSLAGTRRLLDELATAGTDTLLVAGISGGGSAALALPAEGIDLDDERKLLARLLAAGTPIDELNPIRQHVSRVKGGLLARRAFPARTIALLVSDVPGDRLDLIASGPLVPAVSGWRDVEAALHARVGLDAVPASIAHRMAAGLAGRIEPLPRAGDPAFDTVEGFLVARNEDALDAASGAADRERLSVVREPVPAAGEPAGWGRRFAERLLALDPPACLLAGGELVSSPGENPGKGGPCHEAALAAATVLAGRDGVAMLAADTDGIDGNAARAGAIADGSTMSRARASGLEPDRHLARHDAATFFDRAGGALRTGATGTNVMQFFCGVALPARP